MALIVLNPSQSRILLTHLKKIIHNTCLFCLTGCCMCWAWADLLSKPPFFPPQLPIISTRLVQVSKQANQKLRPVIYFKKRGKKNHITLYLLLWQVCAARNETWLDPHVKQLNCFPIKNVVNKKKDPFNPVLLLWDIRGMCLLRAAHTLGIKKNNKKKYLEHVIKPHKCTWWVCGFLRSSHLCCPTSILAPSSSPLNAEQCVLWGFTAFPRFFWGCELYECCATAV